MLLANAGSAFSFPEHQLGNPGRARGLLSWPLAAPPQRASRAGREGAVRLLVSNHEQICCCFLNVWQEQPVAAYSSLDNYCSALPLIALRSSGVVPPLRCPVHPFAWVIWFVIALRHQCSNEKSNLRSLQLFDILSALPKSVEVPEMPNMLSVMPLAMLQADLLASQFQFLDYFEEGKIQDWVAVYCCIICNCVHSWSGVCATGTGVEYLAICGCSGEVWKAGA